MVVAQGSDALNTDQYLGPLPAEAQVWGRSLAEFHVALTGSPTVLLEADAVLGGVRDGVDDTAQNMREARNILVRDDNWTGRAANTFKASSQKMVDAGEEFRPSVLAGQQALRYVSDALRRAGYGIETILTWFGETVRRGDRYRTEWLNDLPQVNAWYERWYRYRATQNADAWLRQYIARAGLDATRQAQALEEKLNEEFEEAIDMLRNGEPVGMMSTIARRFSSDFRSARVPAGFKGADFTWDRSFLNWVGKRQRNRFDTVPGISFTPYAKTSALIGMPASWLAMKYGFGIPLNKGRPRVPFNALNDMINFGAFDANSTKIYPFENPEANKILSTLAASAAGVGVDQLARISTGLLGGASLELGDETIELLPQTWANFREVIRGPKLSKETLMTLPVELQEAYRRGDVKKILKYKYTGHTGLSPFTMAAIPPAIYGTTSIADALVREPYADDPNNNHYWANHVSDSVATALGVGGPIGVEKWLLKKPVIKPTGLNFGILTSQLLLAKTLTTTPPHPEGDIFYNMLGARKLLTAGWDAAGAADWNFRRGNHHGDGLGEDLAKIATNGAVGAWATLDYASGPGPLDSFKPYDDAKKLTQQSDARFNTALGDLWSDTKKSWSTRDVQAQYPTEIVNYDIYGEAQRTPHGPIGGSAPKLQIWPAK